MPFSRAVCDSILGVFRGTDFSHYTTVYVALLTTQPSANDGTGLVEVVNGAAASQWSGYGRQSITTASGWNALSGTATRSMTNSGTLNYGTASISSGTITVTAFAVYDAATAGNLLAYGTLTNGNMVINNTDAVSFAAGALTLSES